MKDEQTNTTAEAAPERIAELREVAKVFAARKPGYQPKRSETYVLKDICEAFSAMTATASPSQPLSIKEKVRAIQAIREQVGPRNCGLKEAKDAYEKHGSIDKAVIALKAESRHGSQGGSSQSGMGTATPPARQDELLNRAEKVVDQLLARIVKANSAREISVVEACELLDALRKSTAKPQQEETT